MTELLDMKHRSLEPIHKLAAQQTNKELVSLKLVSQRIILSFALAVRYQTYSIRPICRNASSQDILNSCFMSNAISNPTNVK